jgi:cytochrome c
MNLLRRSGAIGKGGPRASCTLTGPVRLASTAACMRAASITPAPLSNGKPEMKRTLFAAAAFIAATGSFAMLQKAAAQDVEKGQRSFNKCLPCHAVGTGAENKVGPELNGLDGRHAGTVASFNYSEANKNSGIVWDEATFKDYIRSPQAKIPGTKMAFAGITNPQEIEDLWAYLKQFDTNGEVKK